MENMGDWEQNNHLINELTQGRELARQLQFNLNVPYSSHETREILVQKIISSYEKALSILNFSSGTSVGEPQPAGLGIESPPLSGSPRSEDSDRDLTEQDGSKKRKTFPRWTKRVRVSPGAGLEGPLDDGFSWRKYGQKDILGAKHPRGYYRCTHRNVQGCLATKQVQRSDEDPTIFEITYRGRHTCAQASKMVASSSAPLENQEPIINSNIEPQQHNYQPLQITHPQQQQQEALLNLREGLTIVTEDLDVHQQSLASFHFPPAISNTNTESHVISSSMVNNNFTGNFSHSFISPATSGTNYFSTSSSGMNSFQGNLNFRSSDQSELNEIVSAATSSATNSPTVGSLDFPFGNAEFDPNFTFDSSLFSSFQRFGK
ncbi:hypothetical protein Patl1_20308 [Pistacia atlantica]|uniref:Uncharacterized protein n=1 Tax=Pistacia atlantica TaxID=434234 RepID=A0ACC1BJZ4_9ROSI|nr:hypothetical protein Patl1_20308 [Pistacia atlantica]